VRVRIHRGECVRVYVDVFDCTVFRKKKSLVQPRFHVSPSQLPRVMNKTKEEEGD
jgi:hypothetical protein